MPRYVKEERMILAYQILSAVPHFNVDEKNAHIALDKAPRLLEHFSVA